MKGRAGFIPRNREGIFDDATELLKRVGLVDESERPRIDRVLAAPALVLGSTGAGKTVSVIAPGLENWRRERIGLSAAKNFARTCRKKLSNGKVGGDKKRSASRYGQR